MRDTARYSLLLLGLVIAVVGCGTTRRSHFRDSFRRDFSIRDSEIQEIQFFLSRDVLLRTSAIPEDKIESADRSVLIAAYTPGVARSVGLNWIKVGFGEGGDEVAFVTRPKDGHDSYNLATTVPGKKGLQRVADLEEAVIWYGGRRYQVLEGAGAALVLLTDDLSELMDRRKVVEGRTQ